MMPTKFIKPVALSLCFALLLVGTHRATRAVIADNQRQFEQSLLRQLAAGAEVRALDSGYAIIRDDAPAGHIHEVSTNEGYNGLITLLVAIDDNETILGVRVTEHRETPGLGDKIEPEVSDWIDQFNGRSLNNTRWALQPDGDIDGISGATITAKATLEAVRGALAP